MSRVTAVMLAGTLRPSPLRRALGVPVLCLPVDSEETLLDLWRRTLEGAGAAGDLRIVANARGEVESLEASAGATGPTRDRMQIIAEPAAWRGTGGVLRDVTADLDPDDVVLVAEAACLPPATLAPLLDALDERFVGVVGVCGDDEPAGVYVFARRALETVSSIGYHDVKEQLLPALHRSGAHVKTANLGERVYRIRDRESYLSAVRAVVGAGAGGAPAVAVAAQASVSGSAVLDGFCLVESGAVIEDGAVVHESVVLSGATIGGGAVVSRCVIGAQATIAARGRALRQIVVNEAARPLPGDVVASTMPSGGFGMIGRGGSRR